MDAADVRSSSNDLSSAPNSDGEGLNPDRLAPLSNSNTITVATSSPLATSVYPPSSVKSLIGTEIAPPKTRKPRKKKDEVANSPAENAKKPRKPRVTSTTAPNSRKKIKTEGVTEKTIVVKESSTQAASAHHADSMKSAAAPIQVHEAVQPFHNEVSTSYNPGPQVSSPSYSIAPIPVARSKPVYDPIRGVVIDRSVPVPSQSSIVANTAPKAVYNPSTSPAISSIINQPVTTTQTTQATPATQLPLNEPSRKQSVDLQAPKHEDAMEIDSSMAIEKKSDSMTTKAVTKPRAKEQPPPLPAGSGLLSSTLFGGDSGLDAQSTGAKGPNIVLHIDLNDPSNKVINFARMAEDKYGFAALYPRQAAQRERLAKVAAAGAALERAASGAKGGTSASDSADEDLSVDIDRESDNDGDAVMSGVNGKGDVGNSGTDGPAPRKRRKRKDEYDADDPFVDDSEMLWEAQAAASKDGFFVYIGPLVPEGEKAAVERADGTVKRGRGRGRGGGPGSRGGRGGASSSTQGDSGTARGGGGPGSRGGGVTRKPRITKAERQQRDLEKKQRESMTVLAAKPSTAPTPAE